MKKYLITGLAGFVGKYLHAEITNTDPSAEIHGIIRSGERFASKDSICHELDIRDTATVSALIQKIKPDIVFHLAAQPFVPKAILDPWGTLDVNVKGTLNLLESLLKSNKESSLVYISSADVYGKQDPRFLPFNESTLPKPANPYSASKLAAEVYCSQYSFYGANLRIMIARPFNHIGIGQRSEFVVPNFCKQIAKAKQNGDHKIYTGDLSSTRDFLDVRDVVRAYRIIAEKGVSGEIYNICSGTEVSIEKILLDLIDLSGVEMKLEVDPERLRPVETPRFVGDNTKLKKLGWVQNISLNESLRDIYKSLNFDE
ncbi:GDP-mannose 4,6-dehydratase [Leptospira sp. GIMC2001]|uniref:GDP-mannose 4,6-dehydratase n=1 Tax=Leptospira sp. GIMC2001 TaxID=1513297 RepID=UPI00234A5B14|nr:GDP-mannose 4,6-dehydratase [Leptospira sp. GIMC2001]WCL49573.1 GDP-mannose 4,6-dehydratase [Leptospira sp. GIMC2001]